MRLVCWLAFSVLLPAAVLGAATAGPLGPAPAFLAIHVLSDGEVERWAHGTHNGVWVRETTVAGDKHKLRLWQASDGKTFVQAIYDFNSQLRDCELLRDVESASEFVAKFDGVLERARVLADARLDVERSPGPGWNETLTLVPDPDSEFRHLVDLHKVRSDCKVLHRKIKKMMKHKKAGAKLPSSTENATNSRLKRELFIFPGTNWCGVGTATEKYNDLGLNAQADRCCRQHDFCAHTIEGFTTKYHLFNYRFHTLSHCDCDERFRACLKMVNNGSGNMVGRLFFNIVQMRCFVLKSEKVCARRAWWGKCLKYEWQKTAHLKDALPF